MTASAVPARPTTATGARFLSGEVAWRDASFDYLGGGDIDIEWCYIKDGSGANGEDAGFLDRLRITELLGSLTVMPSQVELPEGSSAAFTLSLDKTPRSNVTVKLTVPTESTGDIAVSPAQVVLSASQSTAPITVAANKDNNPEPRETHVVRAQSPVAISTVIPVITSPDPLPQDSLCAAWTPPQTARHSQPAMAAQRCGRLSQTAARSEALRCAAGRLAATREAA